MGMAFLNDAQKAFINELMDIPFDTFKRQIKIITDGKQIVVSTNPNYDPAYKNKNTVVAQQQVEGVYDAIVEYSPTISDQMLRQNPNINIKAQQGIVRICVKADAAALIRKAKDIQFDGHSYDVDTGDIVRAMFDTITYYDFWLTRRD